jgi:hypothetical protein
MSIPAWSLSRQDQNRRRARVNLARLLESASRIVRAAEPFASAGVLLRIGAIQEGREMKFVLPVALAIMFGLAGCTTDRQTDPSQTATEQLLISVAVDHAVNNLNPTIPAGTKVFVDPQYFDNAPGDAALYTKYAIASIRDMLLRRGARLVDDRKNADMVAEVRTGGQSINHHDFLIGIPAVPVPVPFTTTVVTTPKVALYERDQQAGIAKLAITAYDKNGALTTSTGPTYGKSNSTQFSLLLFFSWGHDDLLPDAMKK